MVIPKSIFFCNLLHKGFNLVEYNNNLGKHNNNNKLIFVTAYTLYMYLGYIQANLYKTYTNPSIILQYYA